MSSQRGQAQTFIHAHTQPNLVDTGPDCDPCGGPVQLLCTVKKGLFWYINIS
jgi:hypothetical protein